LSGGWEAAQKNYGANQITWHKEVKEEVFADEEHIIVK